ncbi:MAG: MotA/TolQ/ExbB proton channel family protein [Pirellulales bacterium]|nr:MotA/TolQ/ExbB proton channel family protein [Pirellulales bacterium]
MRRRTLHNWSVAVLCSLALSMLAPLAFSTFLVGGAPTAVAAEGDELDVTPPENSAQESSSRLEEELAESQTGGIQEAERTRESFLVWLADSLRVRYVVIFLILTFNAVALIVMIVLGMRRSNICPEDFAAAFESKLNQKQYQDAYELAKNDKSFLAKVLAAGMSKISDGYEAVNETMQEVGEEQNMKMEQRNGYIALIAQIGPMFGLLGTVDGMVMAFDKIAHLPVSPKPSDLAQGIGTALVTTIVGLWIAIPLMVFYHLVRNRLARMVIEVSVISTNLMKRFNTVPGPVRRS